MKILLIGSGGREDALYTRLRQEGARVYVAPGTGSSQANGDAIPVDVAAFDELAAFARKEAIDLTLVGPEVPLCHGIVDVFRSQGLAIFGPDSRAARLEGSKDFGKAFMRRYGIPTAHALSCHSHPEALVALQQFTYPVVIKADGLCAGKGVIICPDEATALQALHNIFVEQIFGEEGSQVILEEFMRGPEVSLLCLVSGSTIYPMETAMDYKKAGDQDTGLNTGGMGAVSPNPHWNADLEAQSERIVARIAQGLKAEQLEYCGALFIGYMVVDGQLRVLEFNVRFGDPETEVVLPRLKSSLLSLLQSTLAGDAISMEWLPDACVGVVLASGGYPAQYKKNYPISMGQFDEGFVYHNGTVFRDGVFHTSGGRVLTVAALGTDAAAARERVYRLIPKIHFQDIYYRKDIAAL